MNEIVPGASGRLGELVQQLDHRPERALERGPVLEVERAPELLACARGEAAPRAGADRLVPGLDVVDARGHEDGQRARDDQVVVGAARVLGDPLPLLLVDHVALAVGEHARGARVDHDEPRAAEVAVEREAARRPARDRPRVRTRAGGARRRRRRGELGEQRLLGQLGRAQVADVLVDPVRHERAGDALVPPGRGADVAHPGLGDVPVVVHVVVVEDHRARHGRQQPADVGIAPGLAVEPRVLLEVGDLLARRPARVAARADERARLLGGLVGVDLVAEQQQAVGPFLLAGLQPARERPERVDAESLRVLRRRRACTGGRSGSPTRHEPKTSRARRSCSRVWIVDGGRPSSGGQARTPSRCTS